MDIKTAAQLYLTHVLDGQTPTASQLVELTTAAVVLRQAGVPRLNRNALEHAAGISACNCSTPMHMTRSEFAKLHRDFKNIERNADKQIVRRSALRDCRVHGTTYRTVTIVKTVPGESRTHKD